LYIPRGGGVGGSSKKSGEGKRRQGAGESAQLRLLERITVLVGRTEDTHEALEGVVKLVASHMDAEVCSLYSHDEESGNLTLAATQGLPARSIGRVSMSRGEGLVGLVVEASEPLRVEDALAHEAFKFFPELGEEKYHSFLGVPVGDGDGSGMLGVLVVQSRRRRRFTDDEERLVRAVAGHVHAVMVNAHLTDQLQREEAERERYRRGMARAIKRLETFEKQAVATAEEDDGQSPRHLNGHGASPGFGMGRAFCVREPADLELVEDKPGGGESVELKRFSEALERSAGEVEQSRVRMRMLVPEVGGALYEALKMVLEDPSFSRKVGEQISEGMAAESALKRVINEYSESFRNMADEYLRERVAEVRDVGQRVLRNLMGVRSVLDAVSDDAILVAHELSLSDLAMVDHTRLRGIVTASGGTTSHAAILAKSLEIPTVVGVEGVLAACGDGDPIIVDGNSGAIYIRPTDEVDSEYQRLDSNYRAFQEELSDLRDEPAETLDGYRISLMANVGLQADLDFALEHGAEGVGLYRTELPFLSYRDFPGEDEQVALYRSVFEKIAPQPVTIRTLDLGADKYPFSGESSPEANPFLGWRSIRISLEVESLFQEQLRALLRAGRGYSLRVLFPMITSVEELRRAREIYSECVADLESEGVGLPDDVELGAMIEVPSAVLRADAIVREVDFVSIGTNDLIQYTLAVDRDNRRVASMYQSLHPAVLESVAKVVRAAHSAGRRVAMCGEMAGDPLCTLFLLGTGIDELSMGPVYIPVVKKLIRAVKREDAEVVAKEVLRYDTVEEIKGYLFSSLRDLGLIELVETFS